jgi:hypothetical protein
MELTQVQYELIKDSIERYRLTMTHRFMVFNDEDIHKANVLRKDLGIDEPLPKCSSCDGLAYSEALFGELNKLVIDYEIHQSKL